MPNENPMIPMRVESNLVLAAMKPTHHGTLHSKRKDEWE
jgi:hypothetical protein